MAAPVFEKKFVQDIRQPVRVRRCGDLMFTGDAKADTIYVEVYNDGVPYNLTGTVTLNCIRADGATVAVTGSISGNVAQATLAQACCAISGPLALVMKITADGVTSTILKAVYTVDVGVTGTTVDHGTIVNNVNTLIAAIETAVESIPADYSDLLAAIAPTYSNSSTYAVGDYVWYDGDLYRCKTAIATAESWTAAHWEMAVVGDDITELKSALAEKLDAPSTAGTAGQALVTDGNGNVSWADVKIEVDATLTQQGEAADAKATGDEITELKSQTSYGVFSDYTEGSGIINSSKNWTNATSANYKHVIVPVASGDSIKIAANGNGTETYALLTGYTTPVNNEAVPLSSATGYNNKLTLPANTSITFTVPSDAKYLLVYTLEGSGNNKTPSAILRNGVNLMATTLGNISAIYSKLDRLDETAADFENVKVKTSYTLFPEYPIGQGTYNSSGKWTLVTNNNLHKVIPVVPGDTVSISANASTGTYCSILTSYATPVADAAIPYSEQSGFTAPMVVSAGGSVSFTAPSDAAYMIVGIKSSGNDISPIHVIVNGIDIVYTTLGNLKNTISTLQTVSETATSANDTAAKTKSTVGYESLDNMVNGSGLIKADGTWDYVNNSNHVYTYVIANVKAGDVIRISDTATSIVFLQAYTEPANEAAATISEVTGYGGVKTILATSVYSYTIPDDTHYLYILTVGDGNTRTIGNFTINGLDIKKTIADNIGDLFYPEKVVNWCAMGDSITYGYWSSFNDGGGASSHTLDRESIGWAFLVAKENNWDLTNIAIGGEGYLDQASGSTYRGYTQARATDFSSYNLVTVALGINDWKANAQMGSMNDDPTAETITAFIPAMRATLEAIMTSNPFCKIIVITPLNCNGYDHTYGSQATNWAMGYAMSNSGTLKQFRDKMVEVCDLYGIQYVDMSAYSCINSLALPTMLPDGVHPAIDTHKLLARELAKKITF